MKNKNHYLLAIDQGTTSSRAILFDGDGQRLSIGQEEFPQHYPRNGWVEHDPEDLWRSTVRSCKSALEQADIGADKITAAGITNQRETTLLWDRETGKPVYPAIVWQDRRTADYCTELKRQGLEADIKARTGLLLDPYFSASKLRWILNEVPGARKKAEQGKLAFGTVDSFLLWRLSGGRSHRTDATNASRTLLYNLHSQSWDEELLKIFEIPSAVLPEVMDCAAEFGSLESSLLGAVLPVLGIAGDQQAAAFGQGCFTAGMAKSTYGTGCFLLLNTGEQIVDSANRLLTTVAYQLNGKCSYAIEGSIFMAGATLQWLRDGLKLIGQAADAEALAAATGDELSVYLVPAFTGLGAPYWDADARGALLGMTRDTGIREVVTAGLMSVAYQTRDLQEAIARDGARLQTLRVDGGMAANNYLLQALADLLDCRVDRPRITETTALGAAYLAGLKAGLFSSLDAISAKWQLEQSFTPQRDSGWRDRQYAGWLAAVERVLSKPAGDQ